MSAISAPPSFDLPREWFLPRSASLAQHIKAQAVRDAVAEQTWIMPSRTIHPDIAAGCPESTALLMRGWVLIGITSTLSTLQRLRP